ncbi:hypothetical protein ILUMI_09766 [Ignelater luminosus]|uniref:Uncharacterized protein n=1 Tax=Ignelater luminosus TaxID=2038154 RepID=A0A8K0G9B9_IGNLU|nr:hypothetical protein ILUMI_09766 [Ignelater luminosus]
MKIALFVLCCMLDILTQNVYAVKKKNVPKAATDTEAEENDQNKSTYLEDLLYKALDSSEDSSVSLINKNRPTKPVVPKKKVKQNKASSNKANPKKNGKASTKHKKYRKVLEQISYPNSMEKDIQKRLKREVLKKIGTKDKRASDMERESGESSDSHDKNIEVAGRLGKMKYNTGRKKSQHERNSNDQDVHTELKGSTEEETLEEDVGLGRRSATEKRRFEDIYRYENEPLKNMLLWLVMNSQNPTVKNAIKASKTSVDKYVKHTVDKAGIQAALRYTDYTSVRFDKDRIIMYCGGQMFVYNTMKDSKICFNGQIYEVRLI